MKKKKIQKKFIVLCVLCVLMLSLLIFMFGSNIFPMKYLIGSVIISVFIAFILFILNRNKNKNIIIVSIVMECFLCILSIYGISVLYSVTHMMSQITETVTESENISAYVMSDSSLNEIEEAIYSKFGTVENQSPEAINQMLQSLEEKFSNTLSTTSYSDMFQAADTLRADAIQVLVLNDAYAGLISDIEGYEWFAEETRVIYSSLEEVGVTVQPESPDGTDQARPTVNQEETESPDTTEQASTVGMELMEVPEQVDWEALVNQEIMETPDGTFIAYISGVDTWGSPATKSRSDVNILAVVNTNTKEILLVSTPRDYYVPLSISGGVKDKLTHAGIYGVNVSVETLELLYGVDIQYYVRLNFTGFTTIIDALGGIDVYSDSSFTVEPDFHYQQGTNHLSGIEALAFTRERYSFAGGDRVRGVHQMEVIKAVISKCASSAILTNYSQVLNGIAGCFTTNMSQNKIASLVRMQLNDMAAWKITSISVDGTGASKTTYSIPSQRAYVMIPDESTVQTAKDSIAAILQGK